MRIDRSEVFLFCLYHLHMSFEQVADMDIHSRMIRGHKEGLIDHLMRVWHHQFEKKGLAAGRSPAG